MEPLFETLSPLWRHPEIHTPWTGWASYLFVPSFIVLLRLKAMRPAHWKVGAGVVFIVFVCLQLFGLNGNPLPAGQVSSLRAPATLGQTTFSAAYVITEHLRIWLWPFGQSPFLRPINAGALFVTNLVYWLILALLLRHGFRMRRRAPAVWFGILWAILTLIPISGLWPYKGTPFSGNYLFFPALGLSAAIAAVFNSACPALQSLFERRPAPNKRAMIYRLLIAAGGILSVLWFFAVVADTSVRIRLHEAPTLRPIAAFALQQDPANFAAAGELARAEAQAGQFEMATETALRVWNAAPDYPELSVIFAEILLHEGKFEDAATHLRRALKSKDAPPPYQLRITELLAECERRAADSTKVPPEPQ